MMLVKEGLERKIAQDEQYTPQHLTSVPSDYMPHEVRVMDKELAPGASERIWKQRIERAQLYIGVGLGAALTAKGIYDAWQLYNYIFK